MVYLSNSQICMLKKTKTLINAMLHASNVGPCDPLVQLHILYFIQEVIHTVNDRQILIS